jgi:hypothetical protein
MICDGHLSSILNQSRLDSRENNRNSVLTNGIGEFEEQKSAYFGWAALPMWSGKALISHEWFADIKEKGSNQVCATRLLACTVAGKNSRLWTW